MMSFTSVTSPSKANIPTYDTVNTVVPLVVEQIQDYPRDRIKLWGLDVSVVNIVGVVRQILRTTDGRIVYSVEDHTGSMDCHLWLCSMENDQGPSDVRLNKYVQVFGSIRKFDEERGVMVLNIVPCRSFNEVTTHLLEVLQARYQAETMHSVDQDLVRYPTVLFPNDPSALTPGQRLVYQAVKNCPYSEGISIQGLMHEVPNISIKDLKEITEYLCKEGYCYTSVDVYHFLTTDV